MPEKRNSRRKDARPGEIIDAGMAEFMEKGYAAAKLDQVAKRAGISKGTIYLYYKSKEDLFEAAVKDRLTSAVDMVATTAADFEGPTQDLFRIMLTAIYFRLFETDLIAILRILMSEGQKFPELVSLYHRNALSKGIALFRMLLERGIARGEIRPDAATIDPRVLIGPALAGGVWNNLFSDIEPIDRQKLMEDHYSFLIRGLFISEARPSDD